MKSQDCKDNEFVVCICLGDPPALHGLANFFHILLPIIQVAVRKLKNIDK